MACRLAGSPAGRQQDVDSDGDTDLIFRFEIYETGIDPGHSEACLTARTFDGATLVRCDAIKVI